LGGNQRKRSELLLSGAKLAVTVCPAGASFRRPNADERVSGSSSRICAFLLNRRLNAILSRAA
jgi:hypothetical protein